MTLKSFFKFSTVALAFSLLFTACSEDDSDNPTVSGTVEFQMTDAPTDDSNVKSTFITVTEIKVDGQTWDGLDGKVTLDLLAYQNGDVKALGLSELEAGTYSNITLTLDYETDANGNSPGCYIETTDGVKHELKSTANASSDLMVSTGNFVVDGAQNTIVIIDFDVRKAITYEDNNEDDQYNFVTENELRTSLRFTARSQTGTIKGQLNDGVFASEKVVVYAYKKGEYNRETEVNGQGSSAVTFKNSVSSTSIDANGNYTLAFLEEGEYEVHFAAYEDTDNDEKLELQGTLMVSSLLNLDVLGISVTSETETNVDVNVTGILPL